jgi:hypothetical protein
MKKVASGSSSKMLKHQTTSIHAEDDGMNKLDRVNRFKRTLRSKDKVDVLVVRLSKSGVIGYSRPCRNCLIRLNKSSYPINHIYYTDTTTTIVRERFTNMFRSHLTKMSSGDRIKSENASASVSTDSDNDSTSVTPDGSRDTSPVGRKARSRSKSRSPKKKHKKRR